jgi:hypothetical protein
METTVKLEEALVKLKALDQPGAWANGHDQKVRTTIERIVFGGARQYLAWAIAEIEGRIRLHELDLLND